MWIVLIIMTLKVFFKVELHFQTKFWHEKSLKLWFILILRKDLVYTFTKAKITLELGKVVYFWKKL